jgi:hypothetical protein
MAAATATAAGRIAGAVTGVTCTAIIDAGGAQAQSLDR